jgi:hypothetical protein
MRNVTTNFETWYQANEPEDQDGKDDLIQSVETVTTVGEYTTEEKDGQLLISGWSDHKLRVANEKAKARFLLYVREEKVPDDTELDFQRATEDPRS